MTDKVTIHGSPSSARGHSILNSSSTLSTTLEHLLTCKFSTEKSFADVNFLKDKGVSCPVQKENGTCPVKGNPSSI
jgi:hypothetical protein